RPPLLQAPAHPPTRPRRHVPPPRGARDHRSGVNQRGIPRWLTPERSGSGGFFEDVDAAGRAETDDVGQADGGTFDLTIAGLTAQVMAHLPDVGDAGRRDRVTLGLQ